MGKLSVGRLSVAYAAAGVTSCAAGAVVAYLGNEIGVDMAYGPSMAATWLAVAGAPSCFVAGSRVLQELGQRRPVEIIARGGMGRGSEAIPIHGGRSGHVFMQVLPGFRGEAVHERRRTPELETFLVKGVTWSGGMDPLDIEFTADRVEEIYRAAWRRQRGTNANNRAYPLSRNYFLNEFRPPLSTLEYHGLIRLLQGARLILNRSQGRSGSVAMPPKTAMDRLRGVYGSA